MRLIDALLACYDVVHRHWLTISECTSCGRLAVCKPTGSDLLCGRCIDKPTNKKENIHRTS